MSTHLRGRVRIIGYGSPRRRFTSREPIYEWAVVNTSTGKVVARDDCRLPTIGHAYAEAARLTSLCREALTREIRLGSLRESR